MKKAIYTKESASIRKWLIDKRNEAGLTQRGLADKLNVHHSIVGKIEVGERQINIVEFFDYCKILEVNPIELFEKLNSS